MDWEIHSNLTADELEVGLPLKADAVLVLNILSNILIIYS